MPEQIKSYTSVKESGGAFHEFRVLWQRSRRAKHRMNQEVKELLKQLHDAEAMIESATGMKVVGKKVLEVGPGQLPRQLAYFGAKNDVIGIDLDAVPRGFDPIGYFRIFRDNGIRRLTKTVGRKMMGFDRQFNREMRLQMGLPRLPMPPIRRMDAMNTGMPDQSFDFIYSFSVFEHLPDPAGVLREMTRLLRPGGVIYTYLHLYTCDNGNHDMRITPSGSRGGMPYWAHLRPQHQNEVRAFAYINRLRLEPWKQIFQNTLPGSIFGAEKDGEEHIKMLSELRSKGKLADYSDEELLTHNFIAVWKNPL